LTRGEGGKAAGVALIGGGRIALAPGSESLSFLHRRGDDVDCGREGTARRFGPLNIARTAVSIKSPE